MQDFRTTTETLDLRPRPLPLSLGQHRTCTHKCAISASSQRFQGTTTGRTYVFHRRRGRPHRTHSLSSQPRLPPQPIHHSHMCFTTNVVITMKSPHLFSIVHDLHLHTICPVVTKREDFIATQTVVSQNSAVSYDDRFPPRIVLVVFSPLLAKSPPEFLHFVLSWECFDFSHRRPLLRHRQRSPQSYTSARSLLRRSTLHHNRTPANHVSCS